MATRHIPYYRQKKDHTCGPAVLRMALATHGRRLTEAYLARLAGTTAKIGTTNLDMQRTLRELGVPYQTSYRTRYDALRRYIKDGVVIVDWMPQKVFPEHPEFKACREFNPEEDSHYAIVVAASPTFVTLQDPVLGRRVRLLRAEFVRAWRDPTSVSNHWLLCVMPEDGDE